MAKLTVRSGASTRSEYIFINDSTSTTGVGLTGLVFNSAGLTAYYVTERGTPTAISLVTLASATAAYSSGGFVAVDGTNLPGVYRLDVPAVVFATTKGVVMLKGATNMVPVLLEYDVVAYDPTDTVRLGLTAVPNVAQGSAGALPTGSATGQVTVATNNDKTGYSLTQAFPTNFSSMAITVGGAVTAGTVSDKTGYSLTQAFPTNFSSMAITVGGAVTAGTVSDKTGYSLATAPPTAAQISTQVWSEALPGAFTSGQAGFKLDAGTATNVWGAGTRTLTAGTNISLAKGTGITGFNDITSQSVWDVATTAVTAVGSIGVQLKTNVDVATSTRMATFTYTTPPTAAAIATQVWSEALPGTYTSGQAGFKLNAAGSAADPWSTALPGSYSAGSAGNIIGNMVASTWSAGTRTLTAGTNIVLAKNTGITGFNDITAQSVWDVLASSVSLTNSIGLQLKTNIDTTVSSRLSAAGYTAPLSASATASSVWDALLASYTTANTFGARIVRTLSSSTTNEVTIGAANHIAASVHSMQPDTITASAVATDAVTEITKGIWNQARATASASNGVPSAGTFGYYLDQQVSTVGGSGSATSSPSMGPYTLQPSGTGADNIVDLNVGTATPLVLNLVDGNGAPFNASGSTTTATVYTAGGSTVTTYTGSIIAGSIGAISIPLSTAVTATSATYTMLVSVVIGTTTTVFGPLKLVVRAI